MATRRSTKNAYRNEVGLSGIFFLVFIALIALATFVSSVVFDTRETDRQAEISKLEEEMKNLRQEIQDQRVQQAAMLSHSALQQRLASMNSMLVEIPAGDVLYIDQVPTNPALRTNPTGLASTVDLNLP
ncbi:hypothetical protein [Sulfuriroseicoccus oceanibius]|uniref:Cell division protein FtsL n=1 Tax=Sulfuriroseicoccus oceanibius TaxID=2707525 RepID=A0A6B3L648_9BACT|nr:hypothetical protein [Sulfuriroseicoccus oceanibius]QQL44705.1 hypothetical protein G3M56_012575 [Sulfuriroseicoccus oceanibius]